MANISWAASSLSNSFSYGSAGFSNMFSMLNDSKMIKSGTYRKLMTSYFSTIDGSPTGYKTGSSSDKYDKTDSSTSSEKKAVNKHACSYTYDSNAKTTSSIKNKVLEDLLSKEPKKSTIKNPVLDKLLGKDDEDKSQTGEPTTTTPDGTVTAKPIESEDKTTNNASTSTTTNTTTTPSEVTAGALIDASI